VKTVSNLLAAERDLVEHVPKLPKLRPRKPGFSYLTVEESEKFLDAAPTQWRTWLLVLLRTELRVGEAPSLKWRDVDFGNEQLLVLTSRWNSQEDTPKSGEPRTLPLSWDALAALKAHRHLRGAYVFCHEDGAPFTHSEVKSIVPKTCAAAELLGGSTSADTLTSGLASRGP
jgi:integrase